MPGGGKRVEIIIIIIIIIIGGSLVQGRDLRNFRDIIYYHFSVRQALLLLAAGTQPDESSDFPRNQWISRVSSVSFSESFRCGPNSKVR